MVRHIMYWLRDVLAQAGVSAGPHRPMRRTMFIAFVAFEDVLANHGRFLPLSARSAAASHMECALIHMNALHLESAEKNAFLYHIVPKRHMATHLAYDFASDGVKPAE